MKIKFSRVLATVCALSVAFAGLTAFAADATVVTTTTYDAYANGDGVNITVETDVTGKKGEITYYVSKADGTIVYINQATAGDDGKVSFKFTAKQDDVFAATAKYGTDASEVAFPTFKFAEGINYLTNGTANVTALSVAESDKYTPYDEDGDASAETALTGKAYKARVNGAAIEYGIKVGDVYYPAAGCSEVDGTYIVILNDINVSGTVYAYAKDANGVTINTAEFTN